MEETELKVILQSEMSSALGADGGKLSTDRRQLLEQYFGLPYGTEVPGRSAVTSRNILETIEWVVPSLLRLFTASDNVVEFEAYRPNEEHMAALASQYVNYIIMKDNPGFMIMLEWFKSALIQKVGFIKIAFVEEKTSSVSFYTGLNDLEYQQVTSPDDVEIIEESAYKNPDANMESVNDPTPGASMLHDVTVRVWEKEGRVRITHIVPEEILVSRRAPSTLLDGKHFIQHRAHKTISELREMGFDEDLIDKAQFYDEQEWNTERIARFEIEEDWPLIGGGEGIIDKSMRPILLEESYLSVDFDGDGFAELRKIVSAGNGQIIFSNEIIDEIPIIAICPVPVPGKFFGLGLADLVQDLQEIKTVLTRQILDNLYLTNSPRVIVSEQAMGDSTVEDLLTVRPGGIVRVQDVQGIVPLEIPFVAQASLGLIEYLDQSQEVRTGVSRRNIGLSPDDLNKTALGTQMIQQAAAQRVELIARIFSEQGIKVLAKKILGLVIRHQQQARIVKLTGEWLQVDPRDWRENMDVNVSVGLGTGNRDAVTQHLMQVLQIQQQIVAAQKGVAGPLVTATNIFDVVEKLTENIGFKESFFTNPSQSPPQAQQPEQSPEMIKAQADVQANNMRMQSDMATQKAKSEFEMQIEAQRAQHAMQLEEAQAQHAMQIEQMREQSKQQLEAARLAMKAQEIGAGQQQGGARQARDGNHYLPDPQRPGRFMQIV